MALKLRRGTEAQRIITPEQGELIYVTDTKKVYVGDGATVGGILVGPVDSSLYDVVSDTTPQLGGNLDLNGKDITGTGNININGNITATGTINLGDNPSDNINVSGLINSSLTPSVDDAYSLGTVNKQWANLWATQINVDTTIAVGSQIVKQSSGSIDSSLVLWDAETDTLTAKQFIGDVVGSVFADDSTTIVDSVSNTVNANVLNVAQSLTLDGTPVTFNNDFIVLGSASNPVELQIVGDSTGSGLRLLGTTDTFGGNAPSFDVRAFRGTADSPTIIQNGDSLGLITLSGYNGTTYSPGGFISAVVDDSTITPGNDFDVTVRIGSFTGFMGGKFFSIDSKGIASAPVLKAGSYATLSLPTGADVGEGAIVFDSDTKQFKGWNGTSWVVLG